MAEMVEVTPNALWPNATAGEVKLQGKAYGTVPIVVMRVSPSKVIVQREQYPTGVVIFNENPMQNDVIPKNLEMRELIKDEEEVHFPDTGEKPYGIVVLFK